MSTLGTQAVGIQSEGGQYAWELEARLRVQARPRSIDFAPSKNWLWKDAAFRAYFIDVHEICAEGELSLETPDQTFIDRLQNGVQVGISIYGEEAKSLLQWRVDIFNEWQQTKQTHKFNAAKAAKFSILVIQSCKRAQEFSAARKIYDWAIQRGVVEQKLFGVYMRTLNEECEQNPRSRQRLWSKAQEVYATAQGYGLANDFVSKEFAPFLKCSVRPTTPEPPSA